jgi:hypothetical protein
MLYIKTLSYEEKKQKLEKWRTANLCLGGSGSSCESDAMSRAEGARREHSVKYETDEGGSNKCEVDSVPHIVEIPVWKKKVKRRKVKKKIGHQ